MTLHPPSLLIATAAALALATGNVVLSGSRWPAGRGSGWWTAANTLLVAALLAQAFLPFEHLGSGLVAVVSLAWPVATMAGVRAFFARGGSAVPPWADGLAFSVAAIATLGSWLAPFDFATPVQWFAAAAFGLFAYAAFVLSRLDDFATTPALRTLAAALAIGAAVQVASLAGSVLVWRAPAFTALAPLLTAAGLGLLMTHLAQAMNQDRNVARLRASQRKLRHLVEVDPLTRLPNRRHFHGLAERAIRAAPELATMLVFDVDALQRINELLGHATGDEALRQIGTALRETLRRRDVAGRMGGDEFAAVLPRTRVADATAVIARIHARLDDRQVAPRIARVSLNVGATQMLAGESIADALRRAEIVRETLRDERRGRTASVEATPPMPAPAPPSPAPARADAAAQRGPAVLH